MRILFVYLPLVLLALGFLLGIARLYRTLIFFLCWVTMCAAFYISSLVYGASHLNPSAMLVGIMLAALLALPSIWFATLFSFATSSPITPAPIMRVSDAYQGLDAAQKAQAHKLARKGAVLGAKHLAVFLRNKGYAASADALNDVSKLIR